jgi:uncharacterized protein
MDRPRNSREAMEAHFLGRGWAFPPTFDTRGHSAVMVSQVEDVHESLHILMATAPGERVMQPSYGCGIHRMVFERLDESAMTELRSLIEKAVLFFEPRVTLDDVSFDVEQPLEGRLQIRLDYTIRTTNSRHNLVYPLYLEEGRGARGDGA